MYYRNVYAMTAAALGLALAFGMGLRSVKARRPRTRG